MNKIKGAALRFRGEGFQGQNHLSALVNIENKYPNLQDADLAEITDEDQGFITEEGVFVSRVEAAQIAKTSGQLHPHKKILFGEITSTDLIAEAR